MRRWALVTIGVLVLTAASVVVLHHRPPADRHWPGGPFGPGQCTWYAFGRAREAGWRIRFDRPWGRHGRAWWERVTNAERRDQPSVGAVMVLDAWPGNPYGHVAYVESVDGPDHWMVSHANLAVGDRAGGVDGVPIYRAACQAAPGGVRLGSTAAILRLRGFLYPPGAPPS